MLKNLGDYFFGFFFELFLILLIFFLFCRPYLMDDKCWKVDDSKRKIVDKPMTNFKAFDALDFNTLSFD